MKKIVAPILVFILFSCLSLKAQPHDKYSKVKIFHHGSLAERNELLGLLSIDHFFYDEDGGLISEISAADLEKLRRSGHRYEVLIADVAKHLEEVNKAFFEKRARGERPASNSNNRLAFEQTGKTLNDIIPTPSAFEVKFTFGGYYSYDEMTDAINVLVAAYPTIAQKTSIGKSVQNRDIWCVKISDNVAVDETNEPEVLFMGLQHAREAIGGSSMIFFMQYLCENYTKDSRIRDLVDNREIFIVPCVNPDGWEFNRSTGAGSSWRKNRRNNGSGNYGVDLNRNYGVDWGNCTGASSACGSNSPSSDTYYGTAAFSEPETMAIRDFTYSRRFVAMIDQHAYGPYYSLPFGRPSLHTMSALDQQFYTYVPAAMGTYNGMRAGNSPESVGYEVAGGVKDWMLMGDIGTGTKGKIYGMTGEGGYGATTVTFWPPANQIENLCKGMVFQNLQLLYAAGSYVNLQDISSMNLTTKSPSLSFKMIRVGLDNQPVKVSVVPIENIQSVGSPVTTSLNNYFDSYTGSISATLPTALTNGQRIRFAWKIETGGVTYYDTVVKFYNAQQLFSDDMEGSFATNWTGTNGWGFTTTNGTGYGGGTSKALSESPTGNYTSSSTRICTNKSTFNLSGSTAAYINFWVRHRAENFRDKLEVQVSTDGTNWFPLVGTTTVQEPGTLEGSRIDGRPSLTGIREDWTRETFDLKDYLNATALRLRFVFSSDAFVTNGFAYQVDDGFYIDDLAIFRTSANLVSLPVQFIDFTGRLTPQQAVALEWKALTDSKHSHFEVQRSNDGLNFTALGTVAGQAPFTFTDQAPQAGYNYYRIKQYDIDGNFTYSKTITIVVDKAQVSMLLYPSPAHDEVTLRFTASRPEKLMVELSDLSGRIVKKQAFIAGNSGNELKIDLRNLSSQAYLIRVVDNNGVMLTNGKFVKQ